MASTEAFTRFKHGRRPSEGSTTSARSATTQPNNVDLNQQEDPQSYHAAAWLVQQQQQQQNGQLRPIAPAPRQMSPEFVVHGLPTQPTREYSVDPSVHNGMSAQFRLHPSQNAHDQQQPPNMSHRQSFQTEFLSANGHLGQMDRNDSPAPDSGLDVGNRAPTKARANTNNDHEMRELFNRNSHRSLQDVATELHGNERGPSSERSRQLFAMLWIKSACHKKAAGSVPRSRVYASYVTRCAREKIAVLNPASFGKLVRVLYPGLKTRRLGVRGESKYHYVDFEIDIPGFELVDDSVENEIAQQQFAAPATVRSGPSFAGSMHFSNVTRPSTATGTERNAHSPTDGGMLEQIEDTTFKNDNTQDSQHAIFNQPQACSVAELDMTGTKTAKKISLEMEYAADCNRLILPPITPYLPQGTDIDAAKSLEALYLSHCTSLIECIRFCKEKNFFHLFTAFHGTLTVPVQKLLVSPALEDWIELSDLRMYQNMMQIVSVVALQVIPPFGLQSLRNISEKLVSHIRRSFEGQPEHVFRAKEAPAALFADLLDRALRVNSTAHATANFLHNHANRTQMYIDFITFVRPRKIAQSVPLQGMDDVVNLLVSKIRQLLDPRDVPWDVESNTVQGDFYMQHPTLSNPDHEGPAETANILDRWVGFLKSLASRFPYASHADIVQYVQIIGTTMMRDLTINRAESFGAWWCLKCWIDEMIWFLAEKGGFMKQSTTHTVRGTKRKGQHEPEELDSRSHKRLSTGSVPEDSGFQDDSQFVMNMAGNTSQVLAPLTPSLENQNQLVTSVDSQPNFADDSGISLRMSGDDSPMTKFTNHLESQRTDHGCQDIAASLR